MINKPALLNGRDREWRALTRFVDHPDDGTHLGLVYGRRRQGKTFMLDLLAEQTQGFMFTAAQQSGPQNLDMLGQAHARFLGLADPIRFADWPAALAATVRLGERRRDPTVVILDEFPYLLDSEPRLSSLLQIAIGPTSASFRNGRTRLILCGSALTTMRGLLLGTAPLRGRAALELVLPPFGFREAATFWDHSADPELAFKVNALVGGTPAYRAMSGGVPNRSTFDEWVVDGLLDPSSAMFREGNVLLLEQPAVSDAALYFSVLGAVASGATRRSEIAGVLGRPDNAIHHPLAVLEELRLIARHEDALRPRRPSYHLTEPVIRLQQLVIRPREAVLSARGGGLVWQDAQHTVASKIYGPHLEDLAREWVILHASAESVGGVPNRVQPSTIACREHRAGHELDLVAFEEAPGGGGSHIVAIGEVKATQSPIGEGELTRLAHIRDLLPNARIVGAVKLLLFSRSGPTTELERLASQRGDVEIISLERLYHGE